MLTPTTLYNPKNGQQNGRLPAPYPAITLIDDPTWPEKWGFPERNRTLRLDRSTYALSPNDLPGVTPLHLNENLFAAARDAGARIDVAALAKAQLQELHRYPAGGVKHLQAAVAAGLNLSPGKIVLSHGSAALLQALFMYLLKTGDTLLLPDPGWSFYHHTAELVGASVETFPLLDDGRAFIYDKVVIAAKIEACRPQVVLICSPNNPTGNVVPIEDFLWLVHRYPQVNFILDEAYYGFRQSYSSTQEQALLGSTGPGNLFVVRTFSKFYGLANLRLGFVISSEADGRSLQKIAPVFGLASFNQALAASRFVDREFFTQMQQEYTAVATYVTAALAQIPGFTPYATSANFILVRHDGRWWGVEEALLERGYKIKREKINGAANYLRITLADLETMQKFMSTLRQL